MAVIFFGEEPKNPYHILVSEFLLQKTHVRKVEDIYLEFIHQYPTIDDLKFKKLLMCVRLSYMEFIIGLNV